MFFDLKKIQALFPGRIIARIIDYNDKCYVVEVSDDVNEVNYSDPFYAVLKNNYHKQIFLPNLDIDTFFDKLEHNTIYNIDEK